MSAEYKQVHTIGRSIQSISMYHTCALPGKAWMLRSPMIYRFFLNGHRGSEKILHLNCLHLLSIRLYSLLQDGFKCSLHGRTRGRQNKNSTHRHTQHGEGQGCRCTWEVQPGVLEWRPTLGRHDAYWRIEWQNYEGTKQAKKPPQDKQHEVPFATFDTSPTWLMPLTNRDKSPFFH
jgi:hypothetical protein